VFVLSPEIGVVQRIRSLAKYLSYLSTGKTGFHLRPTGSPARSFPFAKPLKKPRRLGRGSG